MQNFAEAILLESQKMKMKLIVDSGSTKAHWYLMHENKIQEFFTAGVNPVVLNYTQIKNSLAKELFPLLETQHLNIKEVHFYGAGCSIQQNIELIQQILKNYFSNAHTITIKSDLWAGIYASCGTMSGICCILGTGANACVYDGSKIIDRLASLGYILGDEGSGNHIGKALLTAFFYREMPLHLEQAFQTQYKLEEHSFVTNLYNESRPNRLLGSYAHFASIYRKDPFIQKLLHSCFERFVTRQLLKFSRYLNWPIHFIGSVAMIFENELSFILDKYQLSKGLILKSPFPSLLGYHKENP